MAGTLKELIAEQYRKRLEKPTVCSIKINLYRDYEVAAVAGAIRDTQNLDGYRRPDCMMVGDSYLTTHLGRTSTKLHTQEEQDCFLQVMSSLVSEVKQSIEQSFEEEKRPYLIADMPYGSFNNLEMALRNCDKMITCGADALKIEIESHNMLHILEGLSRRDFCTIAHIGYTPQLGVNKIYGATYTEAVSTFALARAVRDSGASVLVLERVSEIVNQMLCIHRKNSLPIYSIFSGKSIFGGQSLNVWDAVFLPPFKAKFFPPTATHQASSFPAVYTYELIKERFSALFMLALTSRFPSSPPQRMEPQEVERLSSIDPWLGEG